MRAEPESAGLDRARRRMGGRVDATGTWRNWTGDQTCRPAAYVRPRDAEEVGKALERARARRWTTRVVGAGHSMTDGPLTDGMMMSLDRMNRVFEVDEAAGTVRVEAGITLHDLNEALAARGLALENLGDIDVQSIAGATATGTHGTGANFRNLSANLASIEIVLPDGAQVEVNEANDPQGWRAARVSVGALGVVTAVTLKVVPAFVLRGVDATAQLDRVLHELDDLVAQNDHFEFYAFPYSSTSWTRTNNRVEQEPRPRSRPSAWFHEMFTVNYAFDMICRTGRRFPSLIPTLSRMSARLSGGGQRIDRSYRIFASPRLVRFTEMEYGLPREHLEHALRAVLRMIEEAHHPVQIPIEARFVAPDDAFLSPSYERETAYLAVHQYKEMEWEPLFRSVESLMSELDGRPHWGKRHFQTAETLAPRYPRWADFQSVRSRMDPEGLFANDHVRRVIGPPSGISG